MTLRFPYRNFRPAHQIVPLAGRIFRPRPVFSVTLSGPHGSAAQDALLDTGADDTVFPEWAVQRIGIDLTNAPLGHAGGLPQGSVPVRYARVTLRIADNHERREWEAWVGFTPSPIRFPVLGFIGFLQYFTATFHGDREEVELTVNNHYPGT
ncbi:MAG TPA: retropepsin-like aspartic protease [Gemmataceae bacterium]|jgi:hypothetical protein